MYKNQLKFQRIVCVICVIAAVVAFVYALGFATDMHDNLRFAIRNPAKPDKTMVEGARIFYDIQPFNRQFVNTALIVILLSLPLFLFNTHSRRKYYIGNYVSVGAYTAGALYISFWMHQQVHAWKVHFLTTVNFEQLAEFLENRKLPAFGPENTFWFDAHYFVMGLYILAVVLLLANTVWKILLMQNEKKLIKAGEEAAQ